MVTGGQKKDSAGEMLATMTNDLSSKTRAHRAKGENDSCASIQTHAIIRSILKGM